MKTNRQMADKFQHIMMMIGFRLFICYHYLNAQNDDNKDLKSYAAESSATSLRLQREYILTRRVILRNRDDLPQFMTQVILKLNQMECRRDNLMDVDELYGVTIEIITGMKNSGLVT
jgi:hypothetical protein